MQYLQCSGARLYWRTLEGGCRCTRIAPRICPAYDAYMPGIIFWLLVIAAILFFKLTTPAERRSMVETYWLIIIGLGAVGFIWQFLRQGTLSS